MPGTNFYLLYSELYEEVKASMPADMLLPSFNKLLKMAVRNEEHVLILMLWARALAQNGRHDAAIPNLATVLKLEGVTDEDRARIHYILASLYYQSGGLSQAEVESDLAMKALGSYTEGPLAELRSDAVLLWEHIYIKRHGSRWDRFCNYFFLPEPALDAGWA